MAPTDRFGLVTFDNDVQVEIPAGPLTDKHSAKDQVRRVSSGGSTNLSAGYLRGLQEATRVADGGAATVLIVSDGHANVGVTDSAKLTGVASSYAGRRVTSSTLGYGLGYDEQLLHAISQGGQGGELFAEDPDTAGALIAGEVTGLLSQTIQAASLLIRMGPAVRGVTVANDVPIATVADGLQLELGGFWAGEQRKLLLTFDIPGMPALGLAQVATLELRYVDVSELKEQTVTIPLHVNVVPGDEAAGRVANPQVVTEVAFQSAQRAKRSASRRLSSGDTAGAAVDLGHARDAVTNALPSASSEASAELAEEIRVIDDMLAESEHGSSSRAAKFLTSDVTGKSRTRGRRRSTS